jgi:ABC-type nitrate/sulfonate/bicarbonate transport system permease component
MWYTSLIAIVLGHVAAVASAHFVALRRIEDPRLAMRSQIPMLVLMIAYTMVSLWIIAQPIVE